MALHHPALTPPPTQLDVVAFFEGSCPELLSQRAEVCRALGGRFGIMVEAPIDRFWVLDLDAVSVGVGPGDGHLDAVIRAHPEELEQLFRGVLDLEGAVASGRLQVGGDVAALSRLAVVLDPG